jgi:hypothetical protein
MRCHNETTDLSAETALVDISQLFGLALIGEEIRFGFTSNSRIYLQKNINKQIENDTRSPHLGHDDYFIARKVELLDSFAEDDFGGPIRIHLSM